MSERRHYNIPNFARLYRDRQVVGTSSAPTQESQKDLTLAAGVVLAPAVESSADYRARIKHRCQFVVRGPFVLLFTLAVCGVRSLRSSDQVLVA